jgi:hypothetical protein
LSPSGVGVVVVVDEVVACDVGVDGVEVVVVVVSLALGGGGVEIANGVVVCVG